MHVDFGCLFDKGLTLEVPEMVPFRRGGERGAGGGGGGKRLGGRRLGGRAPEWQSGCLPTPNSPRSHPTLRPPRSRRLTQNVADACGVSGVEGGFRRAAEITLKVRGWGGRRGGRARAS
jgi:hypothetical protein